MSSSVELYGTWDCYPLHRSLGCDLKSKYGDTWIENTACGMPTSLLPGEVRRRYQAHEVGAECITLMQFWTLVGLHGQLTAQIV